MTLSLADLPAEILEIALGFLVPDRWNDIHDGASCFYLRSVCKQERFSYVLSRCAYQKLNLDSLIEKSWRLKSPAICWLLVTKVHINTYSPLDLSVQLSILPLMYWNNRRPRFSKWEEWLRAACSLVVANKGHSWVCTHLKASSRRLFVWSTFDAKVPRDPDQWAILAMKSYHTLQVAAYKGDLPLVKVLLDNGADPNGYDECLGYPLYAAACGGHADITRLLLERGARLDGEGFCGLPFEAAASQGHSDVLKALMEKDDGTSFPRKGAQCLLHAAQDGHEQTVRLLLGRWSNIDVNMRNVTGQAPLLLAAQSMHPGVARVLLEERPEVQPDSQPNATNRSGYTVLTWAAFRGWTEVMRLLLAREDVDPNATTDEGDTPLATAARLGHYEIVRMLIQREDVQPGFGSNKCPLWLAVIHDHWQIVCLFLEHYHLDPNMTILGSSLLWLALHAGSEAVVSGLLRRADVEPNRQNDDGWTPLAAAICGGHREVVRLLLTRPDVNPNIDMHSPHTPLYFAVSRGDMDIMQLLLRRGDVNPNNRVYNPLRRAAIYGNVEIARLLLERRDIDPNLTDSNGKTALWYAAEGGHEAIAELLLRRCDLNPNLLNPLGAAVKKGNDAVVRLFLSRRDINPNVNSTQGTALWQAARQGREVALRLLLARSDLDPNIRSEAHERSIPQVVRSNRDGSTYSFRQERRRGGGETPLCVAARKGRELAVKLLLEHHCVDPNTADESCRSPLWWAAFHGHSGTVRLLLGNTRTNLNLGDFSGWTPLLVAVNEGQEEIAQLLLGHGYTDPNIANTDGWTPLLIAANNGNGSIVSRLLRHPHIQRDARLWDGTTAFTLAQQRGHIEIMSMLMHL